MTQLKNLLRGIIVENPVLVLLLGTCPTLAKTTDVKTALGMGVAALLVLVCSNIVISLLRKVIPQNVRIPCFIVVIATFVTLVEMLMHAFIPTLYDSLGIFLSLIVVNCIILGRAEMYACKNGVLNSAVDGLGMGIGFTLALVAMSTIREVFGAGSFFGFEIPFLKDYHIPILADKQISAGGFFVFGLLIAIVNIFLNRANKKPRQKFGCDGCPSAAGCTKTSCKTEGE